MTGFAKMTQPNVDDDVLFIPKKSGLPKIDYI